MAENFCSSHAVDPEEKAYGTKMPRHHGIPKFKYACPAMFTVGTDEDYGPLVKDVSSYREEKKWGLHRECEICKLHTSPNESAVYKNAHFYKIKFCHHKRLDRPIRPEDAMRKRAFLIRGQMHGNGGVCGSEVVKEFRTLAQGLKSKPHWKPPNPCEELNFMEWPRLCLSKDYNDCLFIFYPGQGEWREQIW